MRMLMNNLDPNVAEKPDELIVYGGTGKAARNWACYDRIIQTLQRLKNDETLLIQSGKPVGVFRTHDEAPRVLIANSNLVPRWGNWDVFRDLEDKGLTMYGQMTAGSWIYIGSQGIVQGTYETFAECANQHFDGSLAGKLAVTAGLGGMGGAQPLAVTMNDGLCLAVEVDPWRIQRRVETGYCDVMSDNLDEALDLLDKAEGGLSVGLLGNIAEVMPELEGAASFLTSSPTRLPRMTSGLDTFPPAIHWRKRMNFAKSDPEKYDNEVLDSMVVHVQAILDLKKKGAICFDYGNNLRGQVADHRDMPQAFDYPGFVPAYIRPLVLQGRRSVPLGRPEWQSRGHQGYRRRHPRTVPAKGSAAPLDPQGPGKSAVPGTAIPDLLAGIRRTGRGRTEIQLAGRKMARWTPRW